MHRKITTRGGFRQFRDIRVSVMVMIRSKKLFQQFVDISFVQWHKPALEMRKFIFVLNTNIGDRLNE